MKTSITIDATEYAKSLDNPYVASAPITVGNGNHQVEIYLSNVPTDLSEDLKSVRESKESWRKDYYEIESKYYEALQEKAKLGAEVDKLKAQLSNSASSSFSTEQLKAVVRAVRTFSGFSTNKINQIKLVRTISSLGLKEAKDVVDRADEPAPAEVSVSPTDAPCGGYQAEEIQF